MGGLPRGLWGFPPGGYGGFPQGAMGVSPRGLPPRKIEVYEPFILYNHTL